MKRAAIICIATATLLLLGLPSVPLYADTQINSKAGYTAAVTPVGGGSGGHTRGVGEGGGGGGGGTDEGDADGLSGVKNRPVLAGSAVGGIHRNTVVLELWMKFMVFWTR